MVYYQFLVQGVDCLATDVARISEAGQGGHKGFGESHRRICKLTVPVVHRQLFQYTPECKDFFFYYQMIVGCLLQQDDCPYFPTFVVADAACTADGPAVGVESIAFAAQQAFVAVQYLCLFRQVLAPQVGMCGLPYSTGTAEQDCFPLEVEVGTVKNERIM